MYFVLIHLLSFFDWSLICYPCSVDLSSWARKLSEQEKGEEEGILYEDYGSSDESEGISQGFILLLGDLIANTAGFKIVCVVFFLRRRGSQ